MSNATTPTRAIYVPGIGRWVPIGSYVRAIKKAKAHPDAEFKHGLTCWWPCTGAEIRRQFRRGMHDRIGAGIPCSQRGMTSQIKEATP
jgi:hypothetical protein